MVTSVVNVQQIETNQEQVAVKMRDLTLAPFRALVVGGGGVKNPVKQAWDVMRRLVFYVSRIQTERPGSNRNVALQ